MSVETKKSLKRLATEAVAHLDARGRIPDPSPMEISGRNNNKKKRYSNEIDGARLEGYDLENDQIQIRIDDSDHLPFWCEVAIDMTHLQRWLSEQGILMTLVIYQKRRRRKTRMYFIIKKGLLLN